MRWQRISCDEYEEHLSLMGDTAGFITAVNARAIGSACDV